MNSITSCLLGIHHPAFSVGNTAASQPRSKRDPNLQMIQAKCCHSRRSTQTQVFPELCQPVCTGWRLWVRTVKSQGTCHPDLVNRGKEGSDKQVLKQDTGREVILKLDIVTCLVKTESSSVGTNNLVWMDLTPSHASLLFISCLALQDSHVVMV